MGSALSTLKPLHSQPVPDPSWEVIGVTEGPNGKPVYRARSNRARAVPAYDENGKRDYAKHGVTGMPLYGKNKPELYTLEETFYLESDGHGNVYKIPYHPPTPEEIAARKRAEAAKQMVPALAEALVDAGLTPEELVARLRAPASTADGSVQSPTGDTAEPEVEYPRMASPGRWELSNGEIFAGKKAEAQAREAEVQQALADAVKNAALSPEY